MPHYGHHIIDRETGLCEICDRSAIYDIKLGKKPQFLYGNHNGRFVYRPNEVQSRRPDEEGETIVYSTPQPKKRVIYVDKPSPRRTQTRPVPAEPRSVAAQRPPIPRYRRAPTPEQYYYVNDTGEIQENVEPPPRTKPQQYIVQPRPRIIRRQRQPSPKIVHRTRLQPSPYSDSELFYEEQIPSPPKYLNNDHTTTKYRNGDRQTPPSYKEQSHHNDDDDEHSEVYRVVRHTQPRNGENHYSSPRLLHPIVPQQLTPPRSTPSPRYVNGNNNRKLQPIPVNNYQHDDDIIQPTVVRRVYRKLPEKQKNINKKHQQSPESIYTHSPQQVQPHHMQNGYDYSRPVRKVEKLQPVEYHHQSPSPLPENNKFKKPPLRLANEQKIPSIYYIRGTQ
ncbi:unnamed protein product [Didymodactylos carnosus]|uniref:Uncharacterized protein n=1 Tax=Didymodactylos carnosus TaxID=1234261 RepID=A0A813R519_9BILA|nr:unnamed protein product [Didymodactylos carnosus]CAF0814319.1 unnamed protein product [Didymodactylos carnosus]CAF3558631.1 unnamed protein product [Didymodactylos carnosus]CAF3598261.1 unnamed protein product [Didymodactylos carnosus]